MVARETPLQWIHGGSVVMDAVVSVDGVDVRGVSGVLRGRVDPRRLGDLLAIVEETGDRFLAAAAVPLALYLSIGAEASGVLREVLGGVVGREAAAGLEKMFWIHRFKPVSYRLAAAAAYLDSPYIYRVLLEILGRLIEIGEHRKWAEQRGVDVPGLLAWIDRVVEETRPLAYASYRPLGSAAEIGVVVGKPPSAIIYEESLLRHASRLADLAERGLPIIIYGGEWSGRRSLLYMAANVLLARGRRLAAPDPYAPMKPYLVIPRITLSSAHTLLRGGRVFLAASTRETAEKLRGMLGSRRTMEYGGSLNRDALVVLVDARRLYSLETVEKIIRGRLARGDALYTGSPRAAAHMVQNSLENLEMLLLAAKAAGPRGLGDEEAGEILASNPLRHILHRLLLLRRTAAVAGLLLAASSRTGVVDAEQLRCVVEKHGFYGDPFLLLEKLDREHYMLPHPGLRERLADPGLEGDTRSLYYEIWEKVLGERYEPECLLAKKKPGWIDAYSFPEAAAEPGFLEKTPDPQLLLLNPIHCYRARRSGKGVCGRLIESLKLFLDKHDARPLAETLALHRYIDAVHDALAAEKMEWSIETLLYRLGAIDEIDEKRLARKGPREIHVYHLYRRGRIREAAEKLRLLREKPRWLRRIAYRVLAAAGRYREAAGEAPGPVARAWVELLRGSHRGARAILEGIHGDSPAAKHLWALLQASSGSLGEALRSLVENTAELEDRISRGELRLYPILLSTLLAQARIYAAMGRHGDAYTAVEYAEEIEDLCLDTGLCRRRRTSIYREYLDIVSRKKETGGETPDKPLMIIRAAREKGLLGEAEAAALAAEHIDMLAEKKPMYCDKLVDTALTWRKIPAARARAILEAAENCADTPIHGILLSHYKALELAGKGKQGAAENILEKNLSDLERDYEERGYVAALRLMAEEAYLLGRWAAARGDHRRAREKARLLIDAAEKLYTEQPVKGITFLLKSHDRAARLLARIGLYNEALEAAGKALTAYREAGETARRLGEAAALRLRETQAWILAKTGRYGEAADTYTMLIQQHDVRGRLADAARCAYRLALVQEKRGALSRALDTLLLADKYYREAARLGQKPPPRLWANIQVALARIYHRIGMNRRALEMLRALARRLEEKGLGSYAWRIHLLEAEIHRGSGGYVEALKALEKALKAPGGDRGRILLEKTKLLLAMGRHREAARLLDRIEKDKLLPWTMLSYWRLIALKRTGKEKKYRKQLEKTLRRIRDTGATGPHASRIKAMYAETLIREERLREALEILRDVAKHTEEPDTRIRALYLLAKTLRELGETGRAEKHYREAAETAEKLVYDGNHRLLQLLLDTYREALETARGMRRDIYEKWRRRICNFLSSYMMKWGGTTYARIAQEHYTMLCEKPGRAERRR